MQLRYRYRLYPDEAQRQALAQAFGNARLVFNDAVRARQDAYRSGEKCPSGTVLQKRLITEAKKTDERGWLAECSNIVLQQTIRDADAAYKNFFESLKDKRAGRRVGAPRFKSKRDRRQAIRLHTGGFSIRDNDKLRLARIGDVKVAWSRDLPSTPSSVTVVKTADERYFASFVVETGDETLPPAVDEHGQEHELALDLGLSAFAIDQHGRVIDNPRFLRRAERKLKRAQRELSRKQRGSNNRAKARRKVARQHAKVADTRADWLHQATSSIARENQAVVVEDLAVSGLARTKLAKSVHDASWGGFRRLLEEKAARYGRELVVIDRWLPTSQTCSACGCVDGKKPLDVRTWECPCGRGPRPRPQRSYQHPRRRTCGEAKRLWSRRKTPHRGGWRGSRKQRNPARGCRSARGIAASESPPFTAGSTSSRSPPDGGWARTGVGSPGSGGFVKGPGPGCGK